MPSHPSSGKSRRQAQIVLETLEPRELLSSMTPHEAPVPSSVALDHHIHVESLKLEANLHRSLAHFRGALSRALYERSALPQGGRNHPTLKPQDIRAVSIAGPPPAWFTPAAIQSAYGYNRIPNLGRGITVAIVDAYDDPNIGNDVSVFSQQFGLPQMDGQNGNPTLSVLAAQGKVTPDIGWATEISLDVEWVHAVAPYANIDLVEARSNSNGDLYGADVFAAKLPGVSVVSNSYGEFEYVGENGSDALFTTPAGHAPVAFVFSAGDLGASVQYPSASPNVIAVGGTSLSLTATGRYQTEIGWSGGGGGISGVELAPGYQVNNGVVNYGYGAFGYAAYRSTPDVSLVADPATGVAVYDSFHAPGWAAVGGTSLAGPLFSAILAGADQARASKGLPPLSTFAGDPGSVQARMYGIYASPYYHTVFHDITAGNSGGVFGYYAGVGYDLVTGLGSPSVPNLVGALSNG